MSLVRVLGRPFGVPVGHARWTVRTVALVLLVALPPLAHASPPDPLWISGAYDGADLDEVVVAVGGAIGHLEESRPSVGKPGILRVALLTVGRAILPQVLRSTCSVRAPPA